MRDYNHPKCVVAVCGAGGHGKSTLFKKLLDQNKADHWFYYDHKGEFLQRWKLQPCFDVAGIAAQTASGVCCFNPAKMFPGDKEAGLMFFCDYLFTVAESLPGRKILVCDELQDMAFQSRPIELIQIMNDGRSLKIDSFFIVQSTNQLHNNIQNQFTEIFTFRQAHEAATKHLVTVGFDEAEVVSLKPGEWLWRNLTSGEARRGGKAFKIKSSAKYDF